MFSPIFQRFDTFSDGTFFLEFSAPFPHSSEQKQYNKNEAWCNKIVIVISMELFTQASTSFHCVLTRAEYEDLCCSIFFQHYVTPDSLRHGATTVLGKQPDIPQEKRVEFIPVEWRSSLKLDEGKNISV